MKNTLVVIVLLALSVVILTGGRCSSKDKRSDASFKIGLITDVGSVDDKGFNQSSWEAVQSMSEKFNIESKYISTKDTKDYGENIDILKENGYNIIITVGFALGEATLKSAQKYPDVYFIGVDQFPSWAVDNDKSNDVSNYTGLIFKEDQSGFLAGALAAMMTKSNIIAGVFGTNLVPPVVNFKKGYEIGAKHINAKVKIISTYYPGGVDTAFTDPEWGAVTAAQAIDSGADIIFAAAGKTGNGALVESASRGVYCIGVDTDQWETVIEARSTLLSSAIKLISEGVEDLIKMRIRGEASEAMHYGKAGLAPFHDLEDTIPSDVKETLKELDEKIKSGSLKTK